MPTFRTFILGFLISILTGLGDSSSIIAAELAQGPLGKTEQRAGWVRIPVFFSTDRTLNYDVPGLTFSSTRDENHVTFGLHYLPVPFSKDCRDFVEKQAALGWYKMLGNSDEGPAALFIPDEFKQYADTTLTQSDFITRLEEALANSPEHELIIFIHGCCVNHDDAVRNAGALALQFKRPVLLYDWCALAPISQYIRNETLYEQAKDQFFSFMNNLEEKVPHRSTILIAHSMGARFLDNLLCRMADQKQTKDAAFNDVMWVEGDLDARVFLHHQPRMLTYWQRCEVFESKKDTALFFSAIPRYPRLSNPGNLLSDIAALPGEDVIDTSRFKFGPEGHDMPMWLMSIIHNQAISSTDFKLKKLGPHLLQFLH